VRESLGAAEERPKSALPLKKTAKRIHVAGRGADDMPMQARRLDGALAGPAVKDKPDIVIPAPRSWPRSRPRRRART
jgi:hypothetical protein